MYFNRKLKKITVKIHWRSSKNNWSKRCKLLFTSWIDKAKRNLITWNVIKVNINTDNKNKFVCRNIFVLLYIIYKFFAYDLTCLFRLSIHCSNLEGYFLFKNFIDFNAKLNCWKVMSLQSDSLWSDYALSLITNTPISKSWIGIVASIADQYRWHFLLLCFFLYLCFFFFLKKNR